MPTHELKKTSKLNWSADVKAEGDYLGENLKIGCLQRIADATEVMAQNFAQLQAERDRYKQWYERELKWRETLQRSNSSLRGAITRLKKKV